MIEPIESLYQKIGQATANSLPEEWISARLEVELKPGVVTMRGHYQTVKDGDEHSFRPARELVAFFTQLHDIMVAEMKADWQNARLDLDRDGKFNLNFTY